MGHNETIDQVSEKQKSWGVVGGARAPQAKNLSANQILCRLI